MRNYHEQIDKTMFDFESYYLRIASQMPDECRIVECGVANGASAIFLAEAILNLGKTIERFILVDDLSYGGSDQAQTIINHVIQSGIKQFEFIQKSSLDASCKFPDGYLDFCFIDASHQYEPTKSDLRCWAYKMKDGAILSGHDYNTDEVGRAVRDVVPEGRYSVIGTTKGYGIWEIIKEESLKLR